MSNVPLKVHITGVNGLIGNLVYQQLSASPERYDVYGSARRRQPSTRLSGAPMVTVPEDHFHLADLTDAEAMRRAISGMDAVLHIGAVADESLPFEIMEQANIVGTHHVLEACRLEGVKRLVYASSVMVNWGTYVHEEPYRSIYEGRWQDLPETWPIIDVDYPTRPSEPYSATKVWAEGYCHTYVDNHGLSVVCLRIGGVETDNQYHDLLLAAVWCSHRDIQQLFEHALLATATPRYDVAYALSNNQHRWVDLEHTRQVLGYMPQDRAVWPREG